MSGITQVPFGDLTDFRLPWTGNEITDYADFISGTQTHLYDDALANITDRYVERLEYTLRGAWRAGYDYVHVYEAGPSLASPRLTEPFTFHREYDPSNGPPDVGRYRDYKFSYDIAATSDDIIRRAISGEIEAVVE